MTLTEKILARRAGKSAVTAGDSVLVDVDVLMTHDVCGPGTIGVFKREFGEKARVWDAKRVVIIPDHYIFTSDRRSNRNVDILREFVRDQGIPYFYDVIDDPSGKWEFDASRGIELAQYGAKYAGVCHIALPEKGHTRPGEVLVGTDSHTCTAGAFGEFATGIGNTDAAFVMGTGKILLRTPPTMRFRLVGEMQPGVMAKDIILHVIGEIGFDGATYKAMEFGGEGVGPMSIDDRMTVANMGVEAGAKNAIFEADAKTIAFVKARAAEHGTAVPFETVTPDAGANYVYDLTVDLSALEPTVALHPDPGRRKVASACGDIKLDRAYIGSCTGGKTSDFEAFADIVDGKEVRIDTFGVPATPQIVRELKANRRNGRSTWDVLLDAGVRMTENAGCAACLGGPSDTFGRINEPLSCISTTNRNFPGRMGDAGGRIYLASPYTVAASALAGHIVDPRDYLPGVRELEEVGA
ncbi:MAG: 3-isopropylmalate dehydratase [Phycisphaerales bacterium]|nr:3-isopropylmalate dehydratase [Phycisphaerales bacterium]